MTTDRTRGLAHRLAGCALALLACGNAGGSAGDAIADDTACEALDACRGGDAALADVGNACLPEQVPEGGFSGQDAYLERSDAECGALPCLVYRVAGDPRPGCVPTPQMPCAAPEQVQEHVHCSCRCETPAGEGECVCPDGFSCVPVLDQGAPDVVGSYCVRNR